MPARTATDIVILCENALGWTPPDNVPVWKSRSVHAGLLRKAMVKHGVSLEDLELAVAFCEREREPIKSPAALVYKVERARELANVNPTTTTVHKAAYKTEVVEETDLSMDVQRALEWEQMHEDHLSLGWITRLTRAQGDYRRDVLKDWERSGRG